jgi:predicted enzyme related to lactoylglutathione lyase
MPEYSSHIPGSFCWAELATSDRDAARRFYQELFGWEHHDDAIGEGQVYTVLLKNERSVGALYQLHPQQVEQNVPPHWAQYVSVADLDVSLGRVQENGGKVVLEAMDVFDIGRMAVCLDPQGAILSLWQPRRHIGAQVKNEPGSMCWNELLTGDVETARRFYSAVFGWRSETQNFSGTDYTLFTLQGQPVAGLMALRPEWGEVPPNWMVYFAVDDCDATVERARELNGKVLAEPQQIEPGRFTVLQDPQCAVFGVIQMGAPG